MSTDLLVATGFNNIAGLVKLNPQPAFPPVSFDVYRPSLSRKVTPQGMYLPARWNPGLGEDDGLSIFSQIGLSFANNIYDAQLTIGVPTRETGTIQHFNAIVNWTAGPLNFQFYIWKGLEINFTGMVPI